MDLSLRPDDMPVCRGKRESDLEESLINES